MWFVSVCGVSALYVSNAIRGQLYKTCESSVVAARRGGVLLCEAAVIPCKVAVRFDIDRNVIKKKKPLCVRTYGCEVLLSEVASFV